MTGRISRRRALLLLGGAGVATGGALAFRALVEDDPTAGPEPSAGPRVVPAGDVAVIGERYLLLYPDEASVDALSEAVAPAGGDGAAAFAALRGRIHRELRRGEVVRVDGWVLARTEARLCALVHLGG